MCGYDTIATQFKEQIMIEFIAIVVITIGFICGYVFLTLELMDRV